VNPDSKKTFLAPNITLGIAKINKLSPTFSKLVLGGIAFNVFTDTGIIVPEAIEEVGISEHYPA